MSAPNIVFFLLDDLGWRDLSCYGSTFYETPHLDRLAAQGMRFTDAYAACPVCSPTRASLLTGRYPARVGITDYIDVSGRWHPTKGRLVDAPYLRQLPSSETTVAAALRDGGYRTWHVGKWHLGGEGSLPTDHGFDINVGGWNWGHPQQGYFAPWGLPTLPEGEPGEYLTDRLTSAAIDLIRQPDQRPFFLNFCQYAVHTPIQAPAELVAKYRAKAHALRLDAIDPLVLGEPCPTVRFRDRRVTRRIIQSDPTYAAMMENLDTNIGRLLAALDETGQADHTIVVFTSDNGGLATSEGSPTCNAPLQEGKGWMYEGGTREPLIVRWPGQVRAGSVCETPVTSPDFYPTFLEAAGRPLRPAQHCDGESLLPLWRETGGLAREAIFWHYPHYGNQGGTPGCAVRCGDWKLLEFFEDGRRELYNLRQDIAESADRAAAEPARTAELAARLATWREGIEALLPTPNPEWVD
ncbi:MAG: sulfatase [Fimbriimonadaceae bacterium]|nr:sulfatase [Fimbriimonadaceae bacterium]